MDGKIKMELESAKPKWIQDKEDLHGSTRM